MIGILIIGFVKNHFCHCPQHRQSANCCTTCHKWDSLKELATSIFVNKSQFLYKLWRLAYVLHMMHQLVKLFLFLETSLKFSNVACFAVFCQKQLDLWWNIYRSSNGDYIYVAYITYWITTCNILEMEAKFIATAVVNMFSNCTFKAKNL